MKTTLEIPDELYRQAKIKAAHENLKMKDLVSDALRLIIALPAEISGETEHRMIHTPVKISKDDGRPVQSNDAMAEVTETRRLLSGMSQLEIVEMMQRKPIYQPGGSAKVLKKLHVTRKKGWQRNNG